MTLLSKIATFAGALILAGSSFAGQEVCPAIEDIKSEGISMSELIGQDMYLAYELSNYNTESSWGFLIAPIESESGDAAIGIANEVLSTMTAPGVPFEHEGVVICEYETGRSDLFAAAVKDEGGPTPLKLKQYFKKAH